MTPDDPVADALIAFLEQEGAGRLRHAHGRSLLDHLRETYAITRRWNQPEALQHAALIHSVYGTDVYEASLLPHTRRSDVAGIAGEQAERLAWLFCTTPREPLFAGTHRWTRLKGDATPEELDALVLLHMANQAEQTQVKDGSPGRWLVTIRRLAELLEGLRPPPFTAGLATFSEEDEALTRRAYAAGDHAVAAALCSVVPEPCAWMAQAARANGDGAGAARWAQLAKARLQDLGTTWDKRLTYEECLALADSSRPAPDERPSDGRQRFARYVESLGTDDPAGKVYPDLASQPWHDPEQFPLARYLEDHAGEIRAEILAVDPATFHRESERIERAGDWDVAFFYERGRRRNELCEACPVTTRGIESYPAVRTLAGLIYISRMRGGTRIQPHTGPTNLRVRCHLGIQVPEGDCAIRVGVETRHWQEGRCLVFDDHFEHEAWNHTDQDRIVLIVDLWHPALTATEIRLLEGLHQYTYGHARRLNNYWRANLAAARGD